MSCNTAPDAPRWQTCLCFCNPFWCDSSSGDDEDDGATLVDNDEAMCGCHGLRRHRNPMVHNSSSGGGVDTDDTVSHVGLSPREEDDTFTLPADYNATEAYMWSFGEFNIATGDRTRGTGVSVRISDELFRAVCQRLDEGSRDEQEKLMDDFNLYVKAIQHSVEATERAELIEGYERYRDKYRDHYACHNDQEIAETAHCFAKDTRRRREERLEQYRKAIFFTHSRTNKLVIKREYREYCESLVTPILSP